MLLNPGLISAKNRDKDNPSALDDCRLSPAVNLARELWHIIKLWVTIHVEHGQLLSRDAALL